MGTLCEHCVLRRAGKGLRSASDNVADAVNPAARVHLIAIVGTVAGPLMALLVGILLALGTSRPLAKG
jgi:hypothetical protein